MARAKHNDRIVPQHMSLSATARPRAQVEFGVLRSYAVLNSIDHVELCVPCLSLTAAHVNRKNGGVAHIGSHSVLFVRTSVFATQYPVGSRRRGTAH